MKNKLMWLATAMFAIVFAGKARAQHETPCGMQCEQCWSVVTSWAGTVDTDNPAAAHYSKTCAYSTECSPCANNGRVTDKTSSNALAQRIRSASAGDLSVLGVADRSRVLVSTNRNLVVVKGTPCNPQAFAVVLFVTPEKAAALARSGVRRLEAAKAAAVVVAQR